MLFGSEEMPKDIWIIPLKCYGKEGLYLHPRLMKYETGMCQPMLSLEVTVSEWNALLGNRGQLILRDKGNCELDRVTLTPMTNEKERDVLATLIFQSSEERHEPNSVK